MLTGLCFHCRRLSEFVKSVPELETLGNVYVCCGCTEVGCVDKDSSCGDNNSVNTVIDSGGGCCDSVNCGGNCNRLPILSFLVRHPTTNLFLHHNFVCAVLNDVYGIQARGGCACAGPYAQDLMGLSEVDAQRYERRLAEDPRLDRSHLRRRHENSDLEVLRPGFTRLNLPYTASDQQVMLEHVIVSSQYTFSNRRANIPSVVLTSSGGPANVLRLSAISVSPCTLVDIQICMLRIS